MKSIFWILDFRFWITPDTPSSSIQNRQSKIQNSKGQTTIEYAAVVAVTVAAVLLMQVYIERGMAGRLRTSVDSLGEQYDPRHTFNPVESPMTMSQVNDTTTTSTLHTDRDVGNGVVVDVLENTTTINEDHTDRAGSETVGPLTNNVWE